MSVAARFLERAVELTARQSARRLGLEARTAIVLSPVAISLVLHGLRHNTSSLIDATLFGFALDGFSSDILDNDGRRLGDADIGACGEGVLARAFGARRHRAVIVLARFAETDVETARRFLAMAGAATAAALAGARRTAWFSPRQLQAVIAWESEGAPGADPALVRHVRRQIFRPGVRTTAVRWLAGFAPGRASQTAAAE